ncbi:MAG: hypothetical protein HC857_16935, partial [Synechococcales cyanobacterium RU_4_20]|nr:hypothetical protein [Synechococcales cyanobacterium RU_4_20]
VLAKAMVFKNQVAMRVSTTRLLKIAAALAPDRYKDQIQQLAKGPVTAPVGSKAEADVIKATTAEKAAEKSSGESVEGSAGQSVDAATPGAEAPADAARRFRPRDGHSVKPWSRAPVRTNQPSSG